MVGATSIRFVAVALMLVAAACDSAAVSPTTSSASVSASGTGVPRMGGMSMAYDPGSRLVVLFGTTEEDRKATTWTWDGRAWTRQHPRSSPTNLRGELAYDWVSSSLILFGTTYPAEEIQTWAW